MSNRLDALDLTLLPNVTEINKITAYALNVPAVTNTIEINRITIYGIDLFATANLAPVVSQVLTIANFKHFVDEGIQIIPYSVGAYCLFSFDITKVGTLLSDKAWIDENHCLWIKPDGVTIGSSTSSADVPLDALHLLFERLYHNNNCQIYNTTGVAMNKTDPFSDWTKNYKLAIFGDMVATPGIETLICAGVLIDHLQ